MQILLDLNIIIPIGIHYASSNKEIKVKNNQIPTKTLKSDLLVLFKHSLS